MTTQNTLCVPEMNQEEYKNPNDGTFFKYYNQEKNSTKKV